MCMPFTNCNVCQGSLGVVSELTLSCIPAMHLREETHSETVASIAASHYQRLRSCRHVRYMWIPYTPSVVVVTSNPCAPLDDSAPGR
jgi:L-galactono-1,4-lactone dehydrogenase